MREVNIRLRLRDLLLHIVPRAVRRPILRRTVQPKSWLCTLGNGPGALRLGVVPASSARRYSIVAFVTVGELFLRLYACVSVPTPATGREAGRRAMSNRH